MPYSLPGFQAFVRHRQRVGNQHDGLEHVHADDQDEAAVERARGVVDHAAYQERMEPLREDAPWIPSCRLCEKLSEPKAASMAMTVKAFAYAFAEHHYARVEQGQAFARGRQQDADGFRTMQRDDALYFTPISPLSAPQHQF